MEGCFRIEKCVKEVVMEFRDLKVQYQHLEKEIDKAIYNVLQDGTFISGFEVQVLEEKLAEYVGVKHCISCANGTDALTLALMSWNVSTGDAVFVPDFTFFASAEAPAFLGATPVFVDVDIDTYNISSKELERAIQDVKEQGELTPRVVVVVDLFGQPADYPEIRKIAQKYNLLVLEDAAQGFGGKILDKNACSFGDIATTSFFPAKPLGCYGDGGAIFTDNDEWAALIRSLCVHGKGKDKYDNVRIGMNSRLDTIQAAILNVKLDQFIHYELGRINEIAGEYTKQLDFITTPKLSAGHISSWAQYTIVCDDTFGREKIKETLSQNEIPSMIYYSKGMHEMEVFQKTEIKKVQTGRYTNTDYLTKRVLSLPIHPYMEYRQLNHICTLVFSSYEKLNEIIKKGKVR